ncbi:extracellular solute-binding protein [Candidatus Bipolaricaulota bacterium]|nr:extracellular solute-binding protein [Candidatus Bipolaricaulota bacterium]
MFDKVRWHVCLLLATGLMFGLATPVAVGSTTIEVWTLALSPAFDDFVNRMIASFEESHPEIAVNWVDVPFGAMVHKLTVAIAAGQPPDAVNLNTPWIIEFAAANALAPVDDYFPPVERYIFWEGLWNANIVGESCYGVPWYVDSIPILIYNREIFEQAGLDPDAPPATWEEMTEYARVIKEELGLYGFCPTIIAHRELSLMGVPLVTPDGKAAAFNVPAAVERLEWYQMLYNEELMPRELGGFMQARHLFGARQLAMFVAGVSQVKHIEINFPDVFEVTDVAPAPTGVDGRFHAAGWSWSIPHNARHPREGAAFIRWATSPYWQAEFSKLASIVPSTKIGLHTDPWFLERMEEDPNVKAQVIASRMLPYGINMDAPFFTRIPPGKFSPVTRIIAEYWVAAIRGEYTAEEALSLAERLVNEVLRN